MSKFHPQKLELKEKNAQRKKKKKKKRNKARENMLARTINRALQKYRHTKNFIHKAWAIETNAQHNKKRGRNKGRILLAHTSIP